jgi:hypothetical protein
MGITLKILRVTYIIADITKSVQRLQILHIERDIGSHLKQNMRKRELIQKQEDIFPDILQRKQIVKEKRL